MAPIHAPALYTATRLELDEPSPGSTIQLTLSGPGSLLSSSKTVERQLLKTRPLLQDEATFVATHLATESSIFLRKAQRSPRTFLWRILDSRRVLELQAIDLHQDAKVSGEASLILKLRFPHPIRPYGVAFADPEERDALCAFVITTHGDLYTIALKKEMFVKQSASENGGGDWYNLFQPSAFSFRTPYKLFAFSTLELLVSLHDGSLLRLERQSGHDGSSWRDTYYSLGSVFSGSLRGLIPWKGYHTVRFDNIDLDPASTSGALVSPDGQHLITASLDHSLRAWNLNSGKVGLQLDLLGEQDDPEKKRQQYFISPTQSQLIQIVELTNSDGILYYVVAFSPKGQQFKIWGILDADSGSLGVRDMAEGAVLAPPLDDLMDVSMWTMEEFHLEPKSHWRESEIWLRARSGPSSKVFHLKFDLFSSSQDLQLAWGKNWVSVESITSQTSRLYKRAPQPLDPAASALLPLPTITERWIEFLFYPGRFNRSSLGAALHEFSSKTKSVGSRSATQTRSQSHLSLKQQIIDSVNNAASAEQPDDLSHQEQLISQTWQRYFSIVKHLEKEQLATLAFRYDPEEELPWIVAADCIASVRECSDVEALRLTNSSPGLSMHLLAYSASRYGRVEPNERAFTLLDAARQFRMSLPHSFHPLLQKAIEIEVLEEASGSIPERILALDERINLSQQVSDDDYNQLSSSVGKIGGFEEVDNTLFIDAVQMLGESVDGSGGRLSICRYGAKQLIKSAQETIQIATETLLDLVVLVVFLSVEIQPEDLSPQFHSQEIFLEIITQLRDQAVREWMASTMRPSRSTGSFHRKQASLHKSQSSLFSTSPTIKFATDNEIITAQTVLESIFIGDWPSIAESTNQPLSRSLTHWCRAWVYGPDLSSQFEDYTAFVLSHLVKYSDITLAAEFEKLVPTTPWAGYVKGRLAVLLGDFDRAASLFKRSSFGLGLSHFDIQSGDRSRLLDETERSYFTSGLTPYYQHIVSIFEKSKSHSYVIYFANMGLECARVSTDAVQQDVDTDLLSRLFSACMATARFEEAYSAISQLQNAALRKANLTTLITALLSPSTPSSTASPLLNRLPFAASASDADATIANLAAKSLTVSSGTGARYCKALYAFRIARGDYRGAAEAVWHRLQRLRGSGEKAADPGSRESEEVRRCWLALCNCLACVDPFQAWIFSEGSNVENAVNGLNSNSRLSFGKAGDKRVGKERRVITLEECRKGYQEELDRLEAVKMGRFAFTGGADNGGMDVMDML